MQKTVYRKRDCDDRFWSKVRFTDDCWLWAAGVDQHGYGIYQVERKTKLAHRLSYAIFSGPIPRHLEIDHLCRNPSCVSPFHLEAVTHRENTWRGVGPTAINAQKTYCKRGHALTPENTYRFPSDGGQRRCRLCLLARMKRVHALRSSA